MGEVTTTLPESAQEKVDERHKATGISKAEIVRHAVLEYFGI